MTEHGLKLSKLIEECLLKNRRLGCYARDQMLAAVGHFKDVDIGLIDYAAAEDYQASLLDKGLRKVSANSYVKAMRSLFGWAERRSYIDANPFEKIKLFRVPRKIHVFTDAEIEAMLKVADLKWQLRIIAANTAGLRKGEILNMTMDDIDFEKGEMYVKVKEDTEGTWAWEPKNFDSIRTVPLTPRHNNMLVRRIMELPVGQPYPYIEEKLYWMRRKKIGKLKERQRKSPDGNWTRPFHQIMKEAGIKKGKFHDLRKTCLTRWSKSMPYQELHKLAGHSDIKTTLEYYTAVGTEYIDRARAISIGATGLEPATS